MAYYFIWFLRYVFISVTVKKDPGAQYFCPDNWIGFQDKCYYFSKEEGDWNSSTYNCLSQNADLVMIDTIEEKVSNLICIPYQLYWVAILEIFKFHYGL